MGALRTELDALTAAFLEGVLRAVGEAQLAKLVEPDVVTQAVRGREARRSVNRVPPPSRGTAADSAPSPAPKPAKPAVAPKKGPKYVVEAPDGTVLSEHDDVQLACRACNLTAKARLVRRTVDREIISSKRAADVWTKEDSPW